MASARYHDMRQWWRGRSLPMAGVAGVKVAPEEQGRGVGRALMTALLEQMAARGYPLSVLYPATAPVYRSLGWELAGGRYEAVIPARSLRALLPPDPAAGAAPAAGAGSGAAGVPGAGAARPAGARVPAGRADAAAAMTDVPARCTPPGGTAARAPSTCRTLAQLLDDRDIYSYLAPDGVLVYRWDRPGTRCSSPAPPPGRRRPPARCGRSWPRTGPWSAHVRAFVSPADPVTWLAPEPDVTLTRREQWMLRVVDAPAAIAGRGFPGGARASRSPARLADAQRPANSGRVAAGGQRRDAAA